MIRVDLVFQGCADLLRNDPHFFFHCFFFFSRYKDSLIDLLGDKDQDGDKLTIKKDSRGVVVVEGATVRACASADDLMLAIEDGSKGRKVA